MIRKKLADGTIREYRYPAERARHVVVQRHAPGTVGALLTAYRGSPEWLRLKPITRRMYSVPIRLLEVDPAVPLVSIRRSQILSWRDAVFRDGGPAAANKLVQICALVFRWAKQRELMELNPADDIEPLPGGALPAWTVAQADLACAELKPERFRRAVVLARYTAQRRADLCAMRWRQYDGEWIHLVQQKTGVELSVFVDPRLKLELDRWRAGAPDDAYVLTGLRAARMLPRSLTSELSRHLAALGLPAGLSIHGLRKTRMNELAEAGNSTREIMAVSGHKTMQMVEHYTRAADQKSLARAAQERLQTARANHRKPSIKVLK